MFLRKAVCVCKNFRVYLQTRAYSDKCAVKALSSVLEQYKDVDLEPIRLTDCSFRQSFANSEVKYDEFCFKETTEEENKIETVETVPTVYFSEVFHHAFEQLNDIVDGKWTTSSTNPLHGMNFAGAAGALQNFLLTVDQHEKALKTGSNINPEYNVLDNSEGFVAALLTSHLLSPLTAGHQYIISNNYHDKPKYCPCRWSGCSQIMHYGPTKIGNEEMWWGVPDVLLLPNNAVMIKPEKHLAKNRKGKKPYPSEDEEILADVCEIKKGKGGLFTKAVTSQIIAQTITFSLYTSNLKNRKPELATTDVTLIPSLLLTPYHYAIYMYDYKNDILLTSKPTSLKVWGDDDSYNRSAILQIWMILNHMSCNPCMHPMHLDILKESANFKGLCKQRGLNIVDIEKGILFVSPSKKFKQENMKKRGRIPVVAYPKNGQYKAMQS